jgi:23S rRNA pseudouridine2605 synthase
MAALGLEVTRLIRISYGPFQLGELPEGQVQELRGRTLRDQLGPRLIAEAGANFDAPVATPFSAKTQGEEPAEKPARESRESRGERGAGRSAPREETGGLIRKRRFDKSDRRDAALSRLSTKAPAGRGQKSDRPAEVRRNRSSNVWMAPGARPQGEKSSTGEEKVVKVPRKPGDRKAKHDAMRRVRPGRAERAAAKAGGEGPAREYRPRPKREGEEAGGTQDRKPWKGAASRSTSPRSQGEGEGQRGDFRKGKSRDAGSRQSSPAGPSPRKRGEGEKSPGPRKPQGRPGFGPRKGPPKPRGGK